VKATNGLHILAAVVVVLGVICVPTTSGASGGPRVTAGLSVRPDGVLLKDGQPYRGIGINYFSLFYDALLDPDDTSYKEGLKTLSEHNIPFVRFMATAFWRKHMELYEADKETYFQRMDAVVREAEANGIGLIPSLFWWKATVPDLVSEPLDQWGNPDSKTRRFMRTYTEEVMTRYKDSPAIWGWEFGNEYMLGANLPNADKHRPYARPEYGTPEVRTERDDMTGEMIVDAFADFGRTVRRLDPDRAIFSGNSKPRPYAYHNWKENSWTRDTREQFTEMLLRDNPYPMDTLTIHLYAKSEGEYFEERANLDEIVRVSMDASRGVGKPLFIGEFGASRERWKEREREKIKELIEIIERRDVPLAAVWVFNLGHQEGDHNITADNDRAYVLDLIGEANKRLSAPAEE